MPKRQRLFAILLFTPMFMNSQSNPQVWFEVPNGLMQVEGNDGTEIPFNYLGPIRYQQVYDASQFSKVPAGGAFISRIWLRPDCNSVGSQVSSNVQVSLSTTPCLPDQLSAIFAENTGPDATFVWRAERYVPAAGVSGNCPDTFGGDGDFYLDAPFFYDPAQGNLLLDVSKETTERNPALWWPPKQDAQNVMGDSVSRAVAFSLSTNKAEIVDTLGLVTAFEFFPTPTLKVAYESNNVVLTWEWTTKPGTFRLQSTDKTDSGQTWVDYAGQIGLSGFTHTVVLPAASLGARKFFRLFWDTPQPLGKALATPPVPLDAVKDP